MSSARPYFDPRTGEQITADEFMQRYTAAAFIHVEHPAERGSTNDLPGIKKFGPTCPGCGTGVLRETSPGVGEPCTFCADKPQFDSVRKAMLDLGTHERPAYAREHEPTPE